MTRNEAIARADSLRRACTIVGVGMLLCVSHASARTITVVSGTYGANCGAPVDNATSDLVRQCDGRDICQYVPDPTSIGYSGRLCKSDLQVNWRCSATEAHTAILSPGADAGSTLVLSCIEHNGPGH